MRNLLDESSVAQCLDGVPSGGETAFPRGRHYLTNDRMGCKGLKACCLHPVRLPVDRLWDGPHLMLFGNDIRHSPPDQPRESVPRQDIGCIGWLISKSEWNDQAQPREQ
jgi:hypothetical protein